MNKPIQPVGIQWVLRSSILLVLSLLASAADDHTAQHGQHHVSDESAITLLAIVFCIVILF